MSQQFTNIIVSLYLCLVIGCVTTVYKHHCIPLSLPGHRLCHQSTNIIVSITLCLVIGCVTTVCKHHCVHYSLPGHRLCHQSANIIVSITLRLVIGCVTTVCKHHCVHYSSPGHRLCHNSLQTSLCPLLVIGCVSSLQHITDVFKQQCRHNVLITNLSPDLNLEY